MSFVIHKDFHSLCMNSKSSYAIYQSYSSSKHSIKVTVYPFPWQWYVVRITGDCSQYMMHIYDVGAVRSVASFYAAVHMVTGARPKLVIAWEWHIGLVLLCGCSGALKYPTANSCGSIKNPPINPVICNMTAYLAFAGISCKHSVPMD